MLERISIKDHFIGLRDPRMEGKIEHLLIDIIVIAICAVISGADGWEEIEAFGKARQEWFKRYLELPYGMPHHDTYRRVFERLNPKVFTECFMNWVRSVFKALDREVINIDGKKLKGSYPNGEKKGEKMLHLVSAFASESRLILGQVKTADKSNEISAIPELLKLLEIKGCIITIDAMGCQRAIAEQIINQKADYVLAVKGNQSGLHEALADTFERAQKSHFNAMVYDAYKDTDCGHGRIETRHCTVLPLMYLDNFKLKWKSLQSLIEVKSQQILKLTGEVLEEETRYYISSLKMDAKFILQTIRQHWGIESMHWVLDVVFKEDDSRIRSENGSQNFATLRRLALNLLKRDTSIKSSIKRKRFLAALDVSYLEKILNSNDF